MFQIAGSADTAVVNLFDTGIPTLPDNFRREINFVMRRSNAWAQLRNQIAGLDSKRLSHLLDCVPNDSQGSSFLARMNQTNGACLLIDQKNRAAVGHINAEANIPLIRNQPITPFETLVSGRHRIDHRDFVAVNLACGDKFSINQPKSASRVTMRMVQIFQDGYFIVRELDSRNPPHKSVNTR